MAMSEKRMGEIALLHVKDKLRREGATVKPNMRRALAQEAKDLGISVEEAVEFTEILTREVFELAFPRK